MNENWQPSWEYMAADSDECPDCWQPPEYCDCGYCNDCGHRHECDDECAEHAEDCDGFCDHIDHKNACGGLAEVKDVYCCCWEVKKPQTPKAMTPDQVREDVRKILDD